MAPLTLILMGVVAYVLNQQPGISLGLRGLPWLDVPTAFVVLGGLLWVVRAEIWHREQSRTAEKVLERQALRDRAAALARAREDIQAASDRPAGEPEGLREHRPHGGES